MNDAAHKLPGIAVLFGSGEATASGRRVYDWLLKQASQPVRVAILETPAGFQLNSAQVAEKVGDFLRLHLQNYRPEITIVPARRRGTAFSPDDEGIASPILLANVIFLGPGSPTYAIRQLRGSLAWHTVLARHRQGAVLVLASAATITASNHALPVYEIYKAGEDLHWRPGLDLFGPYGLSLVFVSHWNNREGGASFDTRYCYMGQERFEQLLAMLPTEANVVGIDEHTALAVDTVREECRVMGQGTVTLLRQGEERRFAPGRTFDIAELGPFKRIEPQSGIPSSIWERVLAAQSEARAAATPSPSSEVLSQVEAREVARINRDWDAADALRKQVFALGWQVNDTPDGPELMPRSG